MYSHKIGMFFMVPPSVRCLLWPELPRCTAPATPARRKSRGAGGCLAGVTRACLRTARAHAALMPVPTPTPADELPAPSAPVAAFDVARQPHLESLCSPRAAFRPVALPSQPQEQRRA